MIPKSNKLKTYQKCGFGGQNAYAAFGYTLNSILNKIAIISTLENPTQMRILIQLTKLR